MKSNTREKNTLNNLVNSIKKCKEKFVNKWNNGKREWKCKNFYIKLFRVLDYHNLQLNLNLRPVILILSCDKTEKGIFCKYIQCGKEFKCDMDEIE